MTTTPRPSSHIPSLSDADQAQLTHMITEIDDYAPESAWHAVKTFRTQAEIRACHRVADKLQAWITEGREPAKHDAWQAAVTRLLAMAEWLDS